ncbi:MAG: S41 family peptidase [Anaerovoracaceae bacterium]|nr:S41 family peptidase [Clostridiales bacterium]
MIVMKKKKFVILMVTLVILGMVLTLALSYGFILQNGSVMVSKDRYDQLKEIYDTYGKTEYLRRLIDEEYYLKVDKTDLIEGINKGLFSGLKDPYSEYLTKEEYEELMIDTIGEFEGIGVYITTHEDGSIVVSSTILGSPAYEKNIMPGDIITAIDKVFYSGNEIDKAARALRGEKGTNVTLSILRDKTPMEVTLVRGTINTITVYGKVLSQNIGYIRIAQFEKNTSSEFEREFINLEEKGVKGIVIDLRSNGGGLLDPGVKIADLLLKQCVITYSEDRNKNREYYNSDNRAYVTPYCLLVNRWTASTSEILAASVKSNKGGLILGEKTFGKGVVQTVKSLPDGDGVKLTVMQFFAPNGETIHKKGVTPDIEIIEEEGEGEDIVLERAVEELSNL